jgi:carboxypeptidase family protein
MNSVLKISRARKGVCVLGAVVCVLLFSLSLFSQGNFGRILGAVTDQTGGVISGATVTVIDKDRGVARTLTTDQAGEYNAPTLIPGTYIVRVEAKGFKLLERQNVELGVGKDVRVDLTLQPGEQNQTITVTEAIPLVETTNATLGGTLSNSQINDLPLNGRNYQNLMALRPGVMIQPGGSPWTQSTNNIRPDENGWMMDGVINVNFFDARPIGNAPSAFTDAATVVPIDAIQEFNLEENPKAEYGWKPGAVVNVGIRSGTNTLHGTAYAFGRSQALDARNLFNPAPVNGVCQPNPAFLSACNKLPTQLKQFGGTVGGPIKKDKLFFFAGYEGYRSFIGNAFVTNLPETAAQPTPDPANSMVDAITALQTAGVPLSPVSLKLLGCTGTAVVGSYSCTGGLLQGQAAANTINYLSSFPNDNVSDNGIVKMDYALNSKHRISGMFWIGNYTALGQDHPIGSPLWETGIYERPMTTVENWIWTPSSSVVNEFRFGYNRGGQVFSIADQGVLADGSGGLCTATGCGKGYPLNTGVTKVGGLPQINVGFGAGGATLGNPNNRPDIQAPNPYWDVQDSVSYLLGKHALKFGGEFARIEADRNQINYRGQINFLGGNTPQIPGSSNLEDFFAGNPTNAFANVGNQAFTVNWRKYAGFIQDDYRIAPKLMLNLGLRYEYTSPLKEANNLFGTFDPAAISTGGLVQQGSPSVGNTIYKPDYKNFSPRLGFAYDVTGKGTTVIRGAGSIIYSSYFAQQFTDGPQNGGNGGLASVAQDPTAASCTANKNGCPASGNFGGTINSGQPIFQSGQLNWDSNPSVNGGFVYPSAGLNCAGIASCSLRGVNPNLKTPYMVNYNLGVQHTITSNLSLDIGYVGNHGGNLLGQQDINQCEHPFLLSSNGNCIRPYNQSCLVGQGGLGTGSLPCFGYLNFINMTENFARSNYNSLQATLTERATHGLNFTAGYTYGHGLDNGSLNRFGANLQDSTRPDLEYGNSDFDIRHRFTLTASYAIPGKKGFGQLLEGWKLNTILTVQSSQPWSIYDTQNAFSMGNAAGARDVSEGEITDRWDFFGNPKDFQVSSSSIPFCSGFQPDFLTSGGTDLKGVTCSTTSGISTLSTPLPSSLASACKVAPDINTLTAGHSGCFVEGNSVLVPPTLGTFGNMGRNTFRDLGFKNLDFSIFKDFKFKERFGAEFRFEVFNIFNTVNLANPYGASTNGNLGDDPSKGTSFGCGCATPDVSAGNPLIGSGSNRVMQLGLKLSF